MLTLRGIRDEKSSGGSIFWKVLFHNVYRLVVSICLVHIHCSTIHLPMILEILKTMNNLKTSFVVWLTWSMSMMKK